MTEELEFSIILPVCHGGVLLRKALASLQFVLFRPDRFEVIVAGAVADRESREAASQLSAAVAFPVSYIPCTDSRRPALLNAACAAAKGSILAFADDDCIFLPDWLEKLGRVLREDREIGIVGGHDEINDPKSSFDTAMDCVFHSFIGTGGARENSALRVGKYYPKLWNMALPREIAFQAALKCQGRPPRVFDESIPVHEDVDLARRVEGGGRKIIFAPEVRICHSRNATFRSYVRRNFTMARTCRRLGVHRLPHTVLSLLALSVLTLSAASFFYRPMSIVLVLLMGIYAAAIFTVPITALRRTRDVKSLAMIPILLVAVHFARGLGYLLPLRKTPKAAGA